MCFSSVDSCWSEEVRDRIPTTLMSVFVWDNVGHCTNAKRQINIFDMRNMKDSYTKVCHWSSAILLQICNLISNFHLWVSVGMHR